MIASITFTYGDEREEVYKYKSQDEIDKLFRNSFDFNLYVFHNSSDSFIKKIRDNKLLSGYNFTFGAAHGPWPQAFRQTLQILKNKGVKRFVFMEDDVFSVTENKDLILELTDFLKTTDLHYLNLEANTQSYPDYNFSNRKKIIEKQHFNIYDTDTFFFKTVTSSSWSFDHAPYFCDLQYAMNEFYPPEIERYNDIWSIEWLLKHKYDQINMPRYITDQPLFRRVNLLGRNANTGPEKEFLTQKYPGVQ